MTATIPTLQISSGQKISFKIPCLLLKICCHHWLIVFSPFLFANGYFSGEKILDPEGEYFQVMP